MAVRHAPDHVHVVATLVRQDGRRVFPRQDFLRSREASRAVEDRYGLTTTAPVGGTSTPETTRAEWRKHRQDSDRRQAQARPAPAGPDRQVLRARVHDAATRSGSWEEFTDRLGADGVLVRPRFSTVNPGDVTGYAVALRPVGRDLARTGRRSGSAAASSRPTSPCADYDSAGTTTSAASAPAVAPATTARGVPPQDRPGACRVATT